MLRTGLYLLSAWILLGTASAIILRILESFYIDEAFDLAMDILFWPVAWILHLRGARKFDDDSITSDSNSL